MGVRIAIVPHDVPVEKPIKAATINVIAGSKFGEKSPLVICNT